MGAGMAASDIILSYIERKGWQTCRVNDGWHARQPEQAMNLFLSFTPSWICLHTPLVGLTDPGADNQRAALHHRLLALNEAMFMAKVSLDHNGAPILQVELPASGGIHLIDQALGALARYAHADFVQAGPDQTVDRVSKELYFDEPPGIPHEVIASYIQAVLPRGWGARSKPKGITWPLKHKGQRLFEAYLTVSRSWAYFHVPVLPETMQLNAAVQPTFFEYLLGVNRVLYMAKLGLSVTDQVLMMLEVPAQELDFDMFRLVTQMLEAYLDLYAREIQIMSNLQVDRRLMELLGVR
jgi:hypothetical protein